MDKAVPVRFVREIDLDALGRRLFAGAVLGLLGGFALYLNDRRITENVLSHVNHEVLVNYHPDLIK